MFFISKVHTQEKRWFVDENLFAGIISEPKNQSTGRNFEPEIQYVCITSAPLWTWIAMAELKIGASTMTSIAEMWESSYETLVETQLSIDDRVIVKKF